jgi:hypothetical protein
MLSWCVCLFFSSGGRKRRVEHGTKHVRWSSRNCLVFLTARVRHFQVGGNGLGRTARPAIVVVGFRS